MILFPKDLVATRQASSLVKGEWTDAAPVQVPFVGDIQPMANRDAVALNVGRHDLGKIVVYSEIELHETNLGGPSKGDMVPYRGKQYEIIKNNTFDNDIISHFEYVAELRE